jgi:toxin ParE1/3/4
VAELFKSRRDEEDLGEIWRFLAARNQRAADDLLARMEPQLQLLRDFPEIGTRRDDIRPGFRMLVESKYLLALGVPSR